MKRKDNLEEKTVSSKTIFNGKIVRLKVFNVSLPDKTYTKREIIMHQGAVAILPVLPDGRIILIKQYRKAIEKVMLEIPAGTLEKGETPLTCAKRELQEETGFKGHLFKKLLDFYPSAGYSSERIYVYKASGLTEAEKSPDPDEFIETVILPISKIKNLIRRGTIKDSKTLIAFSALTANPLILPDAIFPSI